MLEIVFWMGMGALLLVAVIFFWVWIAACRYARASEAEGERYRQGIAEDDLRCARRNVLNLERKLFLIEGNVEYLQTQNAMFSRVIEQLQSAVMGVQKFQASILKKESDVHANAAGGSKNEPLAKDIQP